MVIGYQERDIQKYIAMKMIQEMDPRDFFYEMEKNKNLILLVPMQKD